MAKFVYVYIGGQMAETPEAQEQAMQAWGAWFGTLGDSVADVGNPFGNSATVSSGGITDGGKSGAGGYSIVSADSLSDATAKAKGCPVLAGGGSVEIYEAIPM
jgi:S1-C subfamily serine protease